MKRIKKRTAIKSVVAIAIVAIIGTFGFLTFGSESFQRYVKSIFSEYGGGLERTVTVYSNTGEEIRSWEGKFDVSSSETETYFDVNGKRVIIHGGIVIDEEQ